jgi:hypothetical protein
MGLNFVFDIFWNESNDGKHYMQELLCGQYPYAINVEDLTQNHFSQSERTLQEKCVWGFLTCPSPW